MIARREFVLTALLCGLSSAASRAQQAAPGEFRPWLDAFRRDALSAGISARTLEAALGGLAPIARVVELDRRQPEATLGFSDYLARVVNDTRVRTGKQRLAENAELIRAIEARFRVPASTIVAL